MEKTDKFDIHDYELNLSSKIGVMLIHGFSSTTYEMAPLRNFLDEKGFRVSARNLPGHGTTVDNCNATKYQEWVSAVEQNLAELSNDCDKVYIIGFSMGAILGLHLSTIFPVEKLVIACPVMSFKNPFQVNVLVRFFNKIVVKQKKGKNQTGFKTVKNYSGYRYYPLIALNEFRKLNNFVFKSLNKVKCPVLYIHSENDKLSLPKNIDLIMNHIQSENKEKLILKKTAHHIFYNNPEQQLLLNTI